MHIAVVGGAGPCIQQWWVGLHTAMMGGAGLCIQQWWVGLDYAYGSSEWGCI